MSTTTASTSRAQRMEAAERRLALPVLIAALASVPATFLTMLEGHPATFGHVINHASLVVLVAEAVVLFALADHRLQWLRRNVWLVGVAIVAVPAVVFAVGPVQLLRLVRVVGALRLLRVRRILKAGSILRRRAGLTGIWARAAVGATSVAAAGFVLLVLADPTSTSRRLLDGLMVSGGVVLVLAAGGILAAATFVVARRGRGQGAEERQ